MEPHARQRQAGCPASPRKSILSFMRSLDTPEVHGYQPQTGRRVDTDKAVEMTTPDHAQPNAVQLGSHGCIPSRPAAEMAPSASVVCGTALSAVIGGEAAPGRAAASPKAVSPWAGT